MGARSIASSKLRPTDTLVSVQAKWSRKEVTGCHTMPHDAKKC